MLNLSQLMSSLTTVNEISVNVKPELPAIIFQLVASFGLFLIIAIKVWPDFKKTILERNAHINKTLDDAEQIKAKSEQESVALQTELNEVKNTKKEIYAQAAKEATVQKEKTIQESKVRGREIIEKSKHEAELSKEMIESQIQKEMMIYVNQVASKFISENISDEEELKMIEKAIAGIE